MQSLINIQNILKSRTKNKLKENKELKIKVRV